MEQSEQSEHSKCGGQRVTLAVMAFLGLATCFSMRACLPVAITEMVVPIDTIQEFNESYISYSSLKDDGTRFNWTQQQQSWIFSSFFVGYVISQIPGGVLTDKFGGKWTFSLGTLMIALCTVASPVATKFGGYISLIILRIVMGLASGTTIPAITVLLSAWIPQKEREKIGSLVYSGASIGVVISTYFTGLILSYATWPYVFYFWSAISIIWAIVFTLICYNDPASHPFISMEEKMYLKTEMGQLKRQSELPPTPWKDIFKSGPVVALFIVQISTDWAITVNSNYMPKYMKEVLNISVYDIGVYISSTTLLVWISSILMGILADFLITRNYLSVVQQRKLFTALASIGLSSGIVAISYAGLNTMLVFSILIATAPLRGCFFSGMVINPLDLSPNYSGSLMALIHGLGSITGVIVPNFVAIMAPDSSLEQWRLVYWVTFGISVVGATIYCIAGSADVQPWNNPKETKSEKKKQISTVA